MPINSDERRTSGSRSVFFGSLWRRAAVTGALFGTVVGNIGTGLFFINLFGPLVRFFGGSGWAQVGSYLLFASSGYLMRGSVTLFGGVAGGVSGRLIEWGVDHVTHAEPEYHALVPHNSTTYSRLLANIGGACGAASASIVAFQVEFAALLLYWSQVRITTQDEFQSRVVADILAALFLGGMGAAAEAIVAGTGAIVTNPFGGAIGRRIDDHLSSRRDGADSDGPTLRLVPESDDPRVFNYNSIEPV